GGYNQVIFWPEAQKFSGGGTMKKVVASLLVLFLGASMVMAEVPVPGATPHQTAVAVAFADVEGMVLGEQDSAAVKGGVGPVAYVAIAAGVGAVSQTAGYLAACAITGTKPTIGGVVGNAAVGAVVGVVGSAATIGKAAIGMTASFVRSTTVSSGIAVGAGAGTAAIQTAIDGRVRK
ncbi:MAG: hypothetical protein N2Z76_06625, partial [Treponemataceae bacterium]|nr:hypothetical protein [Treponemataceae bacterium]